MHSGATVTNVAITAHGLQLIEALATEIAPIDSHGLGLGTWALCPCQAGSDGLEHALAMGHYTADGGSYRYPDGMVLVLHVDPPSANSEPGIAALGRGLRSALGTT